MAKGVITRDVLTRAWAIRLLLFFLTAVCLIPISTRDTLSASNDKPIAKIDGTLTVELGQTVYLNGNLSSDPNGDKLSYRWTLVSAPEGSTAQVGKEKEAASFSVYPFTAGKYVIKLVVNDGYEDSEPAYATITVFEKH
jgi:K319L-like, PKD domain